MNRHTVQLLDPSRKVVARAEVADCKEHFEGTIDLSCASSALRTLFEEFEQIVNGQMFSFLDDIQAKIAAIPLKAVVDNGPETRVEDLQVFPSTGKVSFKLVAVGTSAKKPA